MAQSQVVGRVYAAVPYAGFVVAFCSHPLGVIGIILLMFAIWLTRDLFPGKDDDQTHLRSSSASSV